MTQKFTPEDRSSASTSSGTPGGSAMTQVSAAGKDTIQSVTRELSGEVSHMASGIADEAKKAAETKLGAGKDFAVEHLGSVADALHKTSRSLGSDNVAAGYIEKAAGSVDSVSEYFQTRTLSQLIDDVQGYARREPAVFLGGAFFVGMLGGRFLKAATPTAEATHVGSGQQSSQGNRQGGNGHDRHAQGQNHGQGGQGNHSQQMGGGGPGGQGNKQGGAGQKAGSVSTGTATASSDKSADKSGGKSGSERATEPGYKSPDDGNRSGKGSGAS